MHSISIKPVNDMLMFIYLCIYDKSKFVQWVTVIVQIFQYLEMTITGCFCTSTCTPWATISMQIFQYLEMTVIGCIHARVYIPWTTISM